MPRLLRGNKEIKYDSTLIISYNRFYSLVLKEHYNIASQMTLPVGKLDLEAATTKYYRCQRVRITSGGIYKSTPVLHRLCGSTISHNLNYHT